MFSFNREMGRTFKPQKKALPGSRRYELHKYASATLNAGSLINAVRLPEGEDLHDWLAVNVTDFYNEISLLYGVLMDTCTPACCPTMGAGPRCVFSAPNCAPTPLLSPPPQLTRHARAFAHAHAHVRRLRSRRHPQARPVHSAQSAHLVLRPPPPAPCI